MSTMRASFIAYPCPNTICKLSGYILLNKPWPSLNLQKPPYILSQQKKNHLRIVRVEAIVSSKRGRKPGTSTANKGAKDRIALLNERIRRENRYGVQKDKVDPKETENQIELLLRKQKKGWERLRTAGVKGKGGIGFISRVDPETLVAGEYLVHKKVGIGKFSCLKEIQPDKNSNSLVKYIFIEYADGLAKLPASQAHRLLFRYKPPNEQRKPSLSRLGDTRVWEKRKKKGKLAIQKMVDKMIGTYLERLNQKRPPYPKNPAIAEFVASFPYKPTPDQQQAFLDVERDLTERETPMDRLICGDVGFGKTEVALRAIFYVVTAGKQAMVLAPTTVLAKQHYEVISHRYSCYPDIKVALLSRYQKASDREVICARIRQGDLNIIVGTHSLLGRQVDYRNVGLLVVDEEQRFGVKQKEQIAALKTTVDVIQLSATPIPRTLYLALTGFRDASLIATPPPERMPIQTHISEFDERKIISAIQFELARGGQIYYVVPRIKGQEEVEEFLSDAFPNVELAIAHGKQKSGVLEETMKRFTNGGVRILISTNIVESGLDVPNANTIILEDCHLFGLAQIYQLRGRVGRSERQAHAYLFHPPKSRLPPDALERIKAVEECSELGKGFNLAEKDMGIRGFGSVFGEQQTGDIANVGIDYFFEMLFESLSKVGKKCLDPVQYDDVKLDIDINVRLPSAYFEKMEDPLKIIKEAEEAAKKDIWALMKYTEDFRRLYGKEPLSMELLLKKIYVKRMAADLGISRILKADKIVAMRTNMKEEVFKSMEQAMSLESSFSSLTFENSYIKAHLLLELPNERLLDWLFDLLAEMHNCLPTFVNF